jgi:hypothetical protein
MRNRTIGGLCLLLLGVSAAAQQPQYVVTPAAKPGGVLRFALVGKPGHAFVTLLDIHGGPRRFLGEEFFLGLGTPLTFLDTGILGLGGLRLRSISVPMTGVPIGLVFYTQAIVVDPLAPNGVFRSSNGESTVLYKSSRVLVEEFRDPVLQGYTGKFDRTRRYRLMGAAVTRRVHTVRPRQGRKFLQPIAGPLNVYGARVQMVYRAVDLGAVGDREVLTALRWLPHGKVLKATHKRLVIDAVHTFVVPDYTVDPFTAFPKYPNSGLKTVFAQNPRKGDPPVRIIDGSYAIKPSDVRADGYVSYPTPRSNFVYDGIHSLLLDFKMDPTPGLTSANGQQIQLMVLSSPRPDGRVHASGKTGKVVNPHTVTSGIGDNAMSYMQFEFARVDSEALSPWRKAPVARPNYHTPTIAKSQPPGTQIIVYYRGADSANGTNPTFWSNNINFADARPYLQFRITMIGDARTGAVPSLESIVVPID